MTWRKKDDCSENLDEEVSSDDSATPDSAALAAEMRTLEQRVCADSAIWRAQAFDGYANVRDELHRLEKCAPIPPDTRELADRIAANVKCALREALQAMAPRERKKRFWLAWYWLSLKFFYSGSKIELAWLGIHRARAELYLLYPDVEMKAQTEGLAVLLADLPEASTLRGALTTALGRLGLKTESTPKVDPGIHITQHITIRRYAKDEHAVKPEPGMRAELQRIYEHAMGISDVLQREARVLRNNMMFASASIFIVGLALGVAHAIEPSIVSLCTKSNACPINGKVHPLDVFVVELAGMLGGLLSVVIPLSTGERIMTPYRVFNQQLILKTLAGAATAVGGVLLVGGKLISVVKIEDTITLLAYAVVFGFAQQIVTGAVDRRANTLAKETPSVKGV
jgi:hypothetical protein